MWLAITVYALLVGYPKSCATLNHKSVLFLICSRAYLFRVQHQFFFPSPAEVEQGPRCSIAVAHAYLTGFVHNCHFSTQSKALQPSMSLQAEKHTVSWHAAASSVAAALVLGVGLIAPVPADAISGGGMDYSGLTISGQDFSKGKYQAKDFSGVIAKEVKFIGSDLRGARFFKADLEACDFTGAKLAAASFEVCPLNTVYACNDSSCFECRHVYCMLRHSAVRNIDASS
jgi:Pentapeptide repeats (8 copies)